MIYGFAQAERNYLTDPWDRINNPNTQHKTCPVCGELLGDDNDLRRNEDWQVIGCDSCVVEYDDLAYDALELDDYPEYEEDIASA